MFSQGDLDWIGRGCFWSLVVILGIALFVGWLIGHFFR